MDRGFSFELESRLAERPGRAAEAEYGSNVMVVYQDARAQSWAHEVCERVGKLVGTEGVRTTWWKLGDLASPAVLAGATSTALRADVIVLAVYAGEVLPLPFYIWIDAWLPHRPAGTGTIMAIIGMPARPGSKADRVREYLRLVARQGRLDFLIEERQVTPRPEPPSTRQLCPRRASRAQADRPLERRRAGLGHLPGAARKATHRARSALAVLPREVPTAQRPRFSER